MSPYYSKTRNVPRNHKAYHLLKKLKPAIADKITNFAERIAFKQVHKPFKKLRKKYRLKKVESYIFETQGDINLLCDTQELFPQKNLPENYHFIGPIIPKAAVNTNCYIAGDKPNVLVCMGSSGNWEALNFLNNKEFSSFNIITAGDTAKKLNADHIQCYPFINLETVLPHCSLLICHGGNGTIHFGLKHKTPMLFHTSHFEQEWNAERMQELELGKIINELSSDEILLEMKKISGLLNNYISESVFNLSDKMRSRV